MKLTTTLATTILLFATASPAHEAHGTHAGIRVESVIPDSPAAAAGVQSGDLLVTLDGEEIATMDRLREVLAAHRPGDAVPLVVRRADETLELMLTLAAGPHGGVVMGVRLLVGVEAGGEVGGGTAACLAWIGETYRVEPLLKDLNLDLADEYASTLACVEDITRGMPAERAVKYCDNFLKGHCPGMDLLTEIGEAVVRRCGESLERSLGVRLEQYEGWRTCAEHDVFDRYAMRGDASDEPACRAALLAKCGTNIDAVLESGAPTAAQREFRECCSAAALDPARADGSCSMIDRGFARGPCLDRPVCVNTATTEWLRCAAR